ncbi:hypothetical protein [Priestia filamentosa]|uniref:hypothetical protein n=1 Tax=Priestia filamentosa TaxID=1402861 RepID=UPI003981C714
MREFLRVVGRDFVKLGKVSLEAIVIAGLSLLVSGVFLGNPSFFIFGLYGSATYWIVCYILINFEVIKSKSELEKQTLYEWLDNPLDRNLFKEEFEGKKQEEVLENLEYTYKKVMILTDNSLKKLRLLKAYIEVRINNASRELVFGTLLKVIIAIFVGCIVRGVVWVYAENQSISVNDTELQQSVLYGTYILIVASSIAFIVAFIFSYYNGKTRDRMLSSILDVCIEQLKEEKEEKNKKIKKRRSTL